MNKKSILLIILCALILSPFIFAIDGGKSVTSYEQAFQSFTAKAKQSNETDYVMRPKELMTVKEFLESGQIRTVEVYYTSWSSMRHPPYPSEEAFINNEFEAKSIMKCYCTMVDLSNIKKALKEITLVPMQIVYPDYRLGFVAKDYYSDRELTISFVYNQPVMSINGIQYRTDFKLVASVIDLLPHKSYQEINKVLAHFWHIGNMRPYTQKKEPDKKIDKSNSGKLE